MLSQKNQKKRKIDELDSDKEEIKESFKKDKNTPKRVKKENNEDDDVEVIIGAGSTTKVEKEEQKGNNKMNRIILWLRNDLRVHDNPVLDWAIKHGGKTKEILPVYSFDPRYFSHKVDQYGTQKCGLIRARFIRETVLNLREKLEGLGGHLLVTQDKPEEFLPKLIRPDIENTLVYQQEICKEELDVEEAVKQALTAKDPKVKIQSIWGSTIYHIDDLPYKPATELPHVYGRFR